ncbi:hypothetical protein SAMN05421853_10292 [Roseivivax halotolerans]|uniref:Holin of 3TMs, for gene-transfer release n=1 Tax=Roseivivax halotolerans TaxID=93684 RepID=A0A1I5W340_9RHOB|nr:hypothetical protein [Roseivivax halotolerans]SFQ14027.1 hypothetical protein SAMN05421853_10292 [Roseivivax halotolerans]
MLGQQVRDIIGSVAPTLGSALAGPLAGVAAREISTRVLGLEETDARAIEQRFAAPSAEDLATLQDADREFRQTMAELDIQLERIAASDRADAREMKAKSGSLTNTTLSGVILAGFFALTFAIWWRPPAEGSGEIVYMMLGVVGTMAMAVVTFHFGSSSGSKDKTALLGELKKSTPLIGGGGAR